MHIRTMSKKTLCLLLAALMLLMSLPTAFFAAAEDAAATAQAPLTLQVEMSKSSYFVSAKAKATVTVKNTGAETLKNVAVAAYSEKHQLPKGSEASIEIPELKAGEEKSYSFTMALNRKTAGVTFFERVFLFFAQLFRKFEPMQTFPVLDEHTPVTQTVTFRHGSADATLEVSALYETGTDPVRPQVTFLDKYLTSIVESGIYTIEMEIRENNTTLPITIYSDADNLEYSISVSDVLAAALSNNAGGTLTLFKNAGKIRTIIKDKNSANPKAYMVMAGYYVELNESEGVADMLNEMKQSNINMSLITKLLESELVYCGREILNGSVCEKYQDTEGKTQYNFYFSKTNGYEGLVRIDQIDLKTNNVDSTIILHIYDKITDANAFKVEGKKTTLEELEKLMGS